MAMIPFDEALALMLSTARTFGTETCSLQDSQGRVLAQSVFADIDSPAFDKAAMDGYALQAADLGNELEVIETIPAGTVPQKEIKKGQCSKIMTGSMVPAGADLVVMVEDTELTTDGKMRYTKNASVSTCNSSGVGLNTNIRLKGEDCKAGDLILPKDTVIAAQQIAIMAGVGLTQPEVYILPKVAIITTGSEVIEPHEKPTEGQIRNTNASQLLAQLKAIGIQANYYGIAPDTPEQTQEWIERATEENQMVILTGGVSMGDFDFVPDTLQKIGFDIIFRKVAVQPGKPTLFAQREDKFCLGLPGNPVSAFMQFELMGKPFLKKCMGFQKNEDSISLKLGENFARNKSARKAWVPVRVENELVYKASYNGSGHINSLGQANAIVAFPIGVKNIKQGELVELQWI